MRRWQHSKLYEAIEQWQQYTRDMCRYILCMVMAYIAMAYIAMAYVAMAYVVMAYIVMAYIAMSYIVLASQAYMIMAMATMHRGPILVYPV